MGDYLGVVEGDVRSSDNSIDELLSLLSFPRGY